MKKQLSLLIGSSLLTVGAVAMSASEASALTPTGNGCTDGLLSGTTTCEGTFTGNASNQDLDGLFGKDWETIFKVEGTSGTDGPLTITDGGDGKIGGWELSLDFASIYTHAMFVVKGADNFGAYEWDGSSVTGSWSTADLRTGNNGTGQNVPQLSNFSVYAIRGDDNGPDPEPVPEPAAMAGLMAIGAGIVINRRKKA